MSSGIDAQLPNHPCPTRRLSMHQRQLKSVSTCAAMSLQGQVLTSSPSVEIFPSRSLMSLVHAASPAEPQSLFILRQALAEPPAQENHSLTESSVRSCTSGSTQRMHNQNNRLRESAGGSVWLSAPHLVMWECSLHRKHLVLIQHRHIEAFEGQSLPLPPPQIPLGAAERDVVAIIQR